MISPDHFSTCPSREMYVTSLYTTMNPMQSLVSQYLVLMTILFYSVQNTVQIFGKQRIQDKIKRDGQSMHKKNQNIPHRQRLRIHAH